MQLDAKGINTLRRATLGLFGLLSMGSLMACGYRLRGMVDLPYKVIAITGNPSPPMRADLQRVISPHGFVETVSNPKSL